MAKKKQQLSRRELFRRFVRFMALPEEERQSTGIGVSQQDFANYYGLTKEEIIDFKNDPDYSKELNAAIMEWALHKTPEIVASLYKRISKGRTSTSDIAQWVTLLKQAEYQTNLIQFNFYDKLTEKQVDELIRILTDKKLALSKAR